MIKVLDQATINKIAAGEVVERPSSVVKELVENAIDAGASAITVEIKDGGTTFIRITDNGAGMQKEEVPTAFVRHATSKILSVEDLLCIRSLGFRGEALASIAAVAQVECISKTATDLTGIRYEIHGSKEVAKEEIGAPTGTTIIVRNLFYNVPARKKFLKTTMTEAGYITDLIIRLALSHPDISFKYIMNGSNKIATSGNGKLQDVIYQIYGKDVSSNLLPIKRQVGDFKMEGYIGKAYVSKGNRSFEHYFINGRSIRSNIMNRAIEEGYKSFVMIHKFPFTALHLTLDSNKLDVNVHPQKMEFKYADNEQLFHFVKDTIRQALLSEEMIQDVSLRSAKEEKEILIEQQKKQLLHVPEPFEKQARMIRTKQMADTEKTQLRESLELKSEPKAESKASIASEVLAEQKASVTPEANVTPEASAEPEVSVAPEVSAEPKASVTSETLTQPEGKIYPGQEVKLAEKHTPELKGTQLELPVEQFMSKEARKKHRLIGQVFKTYWMIEYDNKLYVVDQHAAHEKVMFERLMKKMSEKTVLSQHLLPPKVLHLSGVEHITVMQNLNLFQQAGFELEDFGDDSIVLRAMPDDIMGVDPELLFQELLGVLVDNIGTLSIDFFVEKLSGMACKAAIKGNTTISDKEADALIDEMLSLDNPYNCPHGRPTMIAISQYELERKFKRIQDK